MSKHYGKKGVSLKKLILAGILKNLQSIVDPRNLMNTPKELYFYIRDLKRYKKGGQFRYPLRLLPLLYDRSEKSIFDPQYVYQAHWATKIILNKEPLPDIHLDISSSVPFFVQLCAKIPVMQLEYRPPNLNLPTCSRISGNILNLPFADGSVPSLSCLHVIEHIGLGRYGDPIDTQGIWKALAEIERIIAPQGHLYLSVPVGMPAVYFNAGCVFRANDIVEFLSDLNLMDFSYVDDNGRYMEYKNLSDTEKMENALGLFHFRKSANCRSPIDSVFKLEEVGSD